MLHQGQHVFFGCAVSQAARVPFRLEHAAAMQDTTSHPEARGARHSHLPPWPVPSAPEVAQRASTSGRKCPFAPCPRTAKRSGTSRSRGGEKHEAQRPPRPSRLSCSSAAFYKHKKHPVTGALLINATFKAPSEKVTKSHGGLRRWWQAGMGVWGCTWCESARDAHDLGRRAPGSTPRSSANS